MNVAVVRMQIHEAVKDFPVISTVDELFGLPEGTQLYADGRIWDRAEYFLAQGSSPASGDALFTGTARVLWIP